MVLSPRFKLYFVMNQDVAFEHTMLLLNQANRYQDQVSKRQILKSRMTLVWPFERGPLQSRSRDFRQRLNSLGIPHKFKTFHNSKEQLSWFEKRVGPYCFFALQTPYLLEHYSDLTNACISSKQLIYQNYGLNLADTPDVHYGLDIYKRLKKIPVSYAEEIELFKLHGVSDQITLHTGNPTMWEIQKRFTQLNPSNGQSDANLNLLWAPHWSESWGNVEITVRPLHAHFSKNLDHKLTIRSHPLLTELTGKELPPGYFKKNISEPDFRESLHELIALPNVNFSNSNLIDDIVNHNHLLTDGVSIVGFWLASGKKMSLIHDKTSPSFSSIFKKYFASNPGLNLIPRVPDAIYAVLKEISDEVMGGAKPDLDFPILSPSPGEILIENLLSEVKTG